MENQLKGIVSTSLNKKAKVKQFMKDNYGRTSWIILLLLTVFCSAILSGCSNDNVTLNSLVASPDQHIKNKVKVFGQVADTRLEDTSFLVLLVETDSPDTPSLICEFLINQSTPPKLQLKQWVTISGKVDVLAGIIFLRECRLVE